MVIVPIKGKNFPVYSIFSQITESSFLAIYLIWCRERNFRKMFSRKLISANVFNNFKYINFRKDKFLRAQKKTISRQDFMH